MRARLHARFGPFLLAAFQLAAAVPPSPLEAGAARIDLTPPLTLNATLGGYGERMSRPATGVHDRVWAKAIVLRQGDRRFALVTADVLAFPPGFKSTVAARLAAEGWQPNHLLFLPSHAHTSIDMTALNPKNTFAIPQLGTFRPQLHDFAVARLADLIRVASRSNAAVAIASTTLTLDGWNRNRRGGTAVDRDLTLTRIDTLAGQPLAVWVNWTAHPTFMGPEHMEFSGDWPGHLQRTLEALIGRDVTALFYNGAEADQSPTPRVGDAPAWEQAERYGRELAIQAWHAWQNLKPNRDAAFAVQFQTVTLPPRKPHPDFMATGGKEYGLSEANVGPLIEALVPTTTHVACLHLGDLRVAAVPCELAAGLGLEIKSVLRQHPRTAHVAIAGLADEWISYALAPEDYRQGGYEASVSFYGETLGPVLVDAAVRAAAGTE
jgi:hypothetical protein